MKPIGSSSVGATLGLSPYTTAAELAERLRGAPSSFGGSAATMIGNLVEPGLRALHARMLDAEVYAGPLYEAPPWRVADHQVSHPDGYRPTTPGWGRVTEYKALSSWDGWDDEGPGGMPRADYAMQVLHQMESQPPALDTMGGPWQIEGADLLAWNYETGETRHYRIDRSKRGARLVARTAEWYARHVIDAEPVPLAEPAVYVPRDAPVRVYREATPEALEALAALREARTRLADAETVEAAAKAALLVLVEGSDGLTADGRLLVTYHAQSRRTVRADRLRELAAERPDLAPLLEACHTTATTRTLLLKKES